MADRRKLSDDHVPLRKALPQGRVPPEWLEAARQSRDRYQLPVIDLALEGERFCAHHEENGSRFKNWRQAFVVTWCLRDRVPGQKVFYEPKKDQPSFAELERQRWAAEQKRIREAWQSEAGKAAAEGGYCLEFQCFVRDQERLPTPAEARKLAEAQLAFERKAEIYKQRFREAKHMSLGRDMLRFEPAVTKSVIMAYTAKRYQENNLRLEWRKYHKIGRAEPERIVAGGQEVLF